MFITAVLLRLRPYQSIVEIAYLSQFMMKKTDINDVTGKAHHAIWFYCRKLFYLVDHMP